MRDPAVRVLHRAVQTLCVLLRESALNGEGGNSDVFYLVSFKRRQVCLELVSFTCNEWNNIRQSLVFCWASPSNFFELLFSIFCACGYNNNIMNHV